MITVAALFVQKNGVYQGVEGVDPWDEERDARTYMGPYPCIAHPPCQRWGRYATGGPSAKVKRVVGDDDGCFASALASVRAWGGVLEHPQASKAWLAYGLVGPKYRGGWYPAGDMIGWTCCVEQGYYGHVAHKATWLYAVRCKLPSLRWGKAPGVVRMDHDYHTAEERRRAVKTGVVQKLSHKKRAATPIEFRDLLLSIARTASR